MTPRKSSIRRLVGIADLRYRIELGRFASQMSEIRKIENELAQLKRERSIVSQASSGLPLSLISARLDWLENKRADEIRRYAVLRVGIEEARRDLARALGRSEAVKGICKGLRKAAKKRSPDP